MTTSRPPWRRTASLDAGLPTERAPWLAIVLPLVRDTDSVSAAARALTERGHRVGRTTWATWEAWLRAALAAGDLPEWRDLTGTDALPARTEGARVGHAPSGRALPRKPRES